MAPTIDQSDRWLTIDSPFGADQLVLTAFDGEEALSELFSYRLELMSPDDALDADKILGKKVTFTVYHRCRSAHLQRRGEELPRRAEADRGMRTYHAEVVPWTWFLSRTSDCKIFQEKTVKDIIEEVFGEYGLTDFEFKLSGSYTKHVYRVQYRETDLDFICRPAWKKKACSSTSPMRRASTTWSSPTASRPITTCRKRSNATRPRSRPARSPTSRTASSSCPANGPSRTTISRSRRPIWRRRRRPSSRRRTCRSTSSRLSRPLSEKGDGKALSKLRMEEEEAAYDVAGGNATCRTFSPGGKFEIARHDISARSARNTR